MRHVWNAASGGGQCRTGAGRLAALAGAEHVRRQAVAGGILTGAGRDRAWCWPTGGVTTGGGLCRTRCWSIGGLGWRGAPSVQRRSMAGVVRTGAGLCCIRCWSTGGFGCAAPSVRRRAVAGGVATGAGRGQAWCWRSAALTDAETFSPPSCGGRSRIAAWPRVCPESASFCSVPSMLRLAVAV